MFMDLKIIRTLACGVVVLSAVTAAPGVVAAENPELDQAVEGLRTGIAEWRREDGRYRAARAGAKISAREADEYAEFVAGLRLRVLEQCEVVRGLGGEDAVRPYECVRAGNEVQAPSVVVPPRAVLTDEEKRAALHARLDAVEGDIDEALLKRQEELRTKGRGTNPGGTAPGAPGGAAGSGGGKTGQTSAEGPKWGPVDGQQKDEPGSAASGTQAGQGGLGGEAAEHKGAPRQTAAEGGSDDDVVARQLREAAERETDPVLKEKLWAEYRKYREARR